MQHSATYPLRAIESAREEGLAKATLAGIKASNYDLIVVVSADLRAAEKIPELISCVENGADIAIGSRRAKRDVSDGSGFFQRITRTGADLFARTLFWEYETSRTSGLVFSPLERTLLRVRNSIRRETTFCLRFSLKEIIIRLPRSLMSQVTETLRSIREKGEIRRTISVTCRASFGGRANSTGF